LVGELEKRLDRGVARAACERWACGVGGGGTRPPVHALEPLGDLANGFVVCAADGEDAAEHEDDLSKELA
jgi:hypothetical protein